MSVYIVRRRRRRLDRPAASAAWSRDAIDWHWIFFINMPIGVVTCVLGRALIEESEGIGLDQGVDVARLGRRHRRADARRLRHRQDQRLRLGLGPHARPSAARALALLVAFLVARGARARTRSCRCASCACAASRASSVVRGLLASGMFSTFFLGALYLEHVRGYGALRTGLAFLPADARRRRALGRRRPRA